MDELDLINYIRELWHSCDIPEYVTIGPGDDCASLNVGDSNVAVSTDMVIEGTHFTPDVAPELIARKAVGRAVSDLAAMAARPLCCLSAVSFPADKSDDFQRRLYKSIYDNALEMSVPLVGGDTGSGSSELTVSVTVLGCAGSGGLVRRDGARPGDAVCVTGELGGSIKGRHLDPQPRVNEALKLAENYDLHAMIDISDGLSTDLLHIVTESGVGVRLSAANIPIHKDALALAQNTNGWENQVIINALGDGEDYELLFCLPENQANNLACSGIDGVKVSIIGSIVKDRENKSILWPDGTQTKLRDLGWHHLKNK